MAMTKCLQMVLAILSMSIALPSNADTKSEPKPFAAHNPNLNYWQHSKTGAAKKLAKLRSLNRLGVLSIAGQISERCDHVDINPHAKPMAKQSFNRSVVANSKKKVKATLRKYEAAYQKRYGVSFSQDAKTDLCRVADQEFKSQSALTFFLLDMRLQ